MNAAQLLPLVDLALAVSAAELLWRLWRADSVAAGWRAAPHLLAGLALMLGLRLALAGAAGWGVLACLICSGIAHALDSLLPGPEARTRCRAGRSLNSTESLKP